MSGAVKSVLKKALIFVSSMLSQLMELPCVPVYTVPESHSVLVTQGSA